MSRAHLTLLRSQDRLQGLRDHVGRPLPSAPRIGLRFEVQWGADPCCVDTWTVRRVNTRSFYASTWGRPLERRLLSEWRCWLDERADEGDLRLVDDAPPVLECLAGGLTD